MNWSVHGLVCWSFNNRKAKSGDTKWLDVLS